MGLKGKALNPLGVHFASTPAGCKDCVDGVNDPVLTDDIGGVGCSTAMVVELTNQGFIHVCLPELVLTRNHMATKGFEGPLQLVGVEILGDDVGFNNLFSQNAIKVLNGGIGKSEDGKGAIPSKDLGTVSLVDSGLEGIKIVVFLDFVWFFVFQGREVAVTNAGTFHGVKGTQNVLWSAIFSKFVGVRHLVV